MGQQALKPVLPKTTDVITLCDDEIEITIAGCSLQGCRSYQEDRYSIHVYRHAKAADEPVSFTVVISLFDGHGGYQTSEACKRLWGPYLLSRMHPELLENYDPKNPPETDSSSMFTRESISNTFLHFDTTVLRSNAHISAGSTGTTLVINTALRRALLAHIGDSRAIVLPMYRKPIYSTLDHSPDVPGEYNRIIEAGLRVQNGRVLYSNVSSLNLSRSFGDKNYKGCVRKSCALQAVTAQPDVASIEYLFVKKDVYDTLISNNGTNGTTGSTNKSGDTTDTSNECLFCYCHDSSTFTNANKKKKLIGGNGGSSSSSNSNSKTHTHMYPVDILDNETIEDKYTPKHCACITRETSKNNFAVTICVEPSPSKVVEYTCHDPADVLTTTNTGANTSTRKNARTHRPLMTSQSHGIFNDDEEEEDHDFDGAGFEDSESSEDSYDDDEENDNDMYLDAQGDLTGATEGDNDNSTEEDNNTMGEEGSTSTSSRAQKRAKSTKTTGTDGSSTPTTPQLSSLSDTKLETNSMSTLDTTNATNTLSRTSTTVYSNTTSPDATGTSTSSSSNNSKKHKQKLVSTFVPSNPDCDNSRVFDSNDLVFVLSTDGIWNGAYPAKALPRSIHNDIERQVLYDIHTKLTNASYIHYVNTLRIYYLEHIAVPYHTYVCSFPVPNGFAISGIPPGLLKHVTPLVSSTDDAITITNWHLQACVWYVYHVLPIINALPKQKRTQNATNTTNNTPQVITLTETNVETIFAHPKIVQVMKTLTGEAPNIIHKAFTTYFNNLPYYYYRTQYSAEDHVNKPYIYTTTSGSTRGDNPSSTFAADPYAQEMDNLREKYPNTPTYQELLQLFHTKHFAPMLSTGPIGTVLTQLTSYLLTQLVHCNRSNSKGSTDNMTSMLVSIRPRIKPTTNTNTSTSTGITGNEKFTGMKLPHSYPQEVVNTNPSNIIQVAEPQCVLKLDFTDTTDAQLKASTKVKRKDQEEQGEAQDADHTKRPKNV